MVNSYSDLFHLNKYKDEIISFEGFGEKSYDNLIKSIEKARKVKTANFIYALGIPEVGLSRAKLICKEYKNDFEKIRNLSFEELSAIDGIGEVIALEWGNYFSNEEFSNEVDNLLKEITFDVSSNSSLVLENNSDSDNININIKEYEFNFFKHNNSTKEYKDTCEETSSTMVLL